MHDYQAYCDADSLMLNAEVLWSAGCCVLQTVISLSACHLTPHSLGYGLVKYGKTELEREWLSGQ